MMQAYNLEMEQAILGGIMHEPRTYERAARHVSAKSFYQQTHSSIFALMGKLHARGMPPDFNLVVESLTTSGNLDKAGGLDALVNMLNATPTGSQVEAHSKRLAELAVLRGLLAACSDTFLEAENQNGSIEEILDRAQNRIVLLRRTSYSHEAEHIQAPMDRIWSSLTERIQILEQMQKEGRSEEEIRETLMPGLRTHFYKFDEMTGGLGPGEMLVVAGQTGGGKTACALSMLYNFAEHGTPVLYFSMEMNNERLTKRLISVATLRSGIPGGVVSKAQWNYPAMTDAQWKALDFANKKLAGMPVYLVQEPDLTLSKMRAITARHAHQHGIKAFFVDYLQLMDSSDFQEDNSAKRSAKMAQGIKNIGEALAISSGVLTQFNRVGQRAQRAGITDYAETSGLANAADYCLNIHIHRSDAAKPIARAKMMLDKQRDGPTGWFPMQFIRSCTYFGNPTGATSEWEEDEPAPKHGGNPNER